MGYGVDPTTAQIAGLENCIGDWIATLDLFYDPPEAIPQLFEAATQAGADVALGTFGTQSPRTGGGRVLSFLFHKTFRAIHGFSLEEEAPSVRLLSRTLVNGNRTRQPSGGLRSGNSHRRVSEGTRTHPPHWASPSSVLQRMQARWRVLIGMNAVPLRLANAFAGLGAAAGFLYSIYTVAVYLFYNAVVPG